jgi:hypothetical protein
MTRLFLGLLLLLVGALVWPFSALRRFLWRELGAYPNWFRWLVFSVCVVVTALALIGWGAAILGY